MGCIELGWGRVTWGSMGWFGVVQDRIGWGWVYWVGLGWIGMGQHGLGWGGKWGMVGCVS